MKISPSLQRCLIAFFACIMLVVLSIAFENVVDGVAKLGYKPFPKLRVEPCQAANAQSAHDEGCYTRHCEDNDDTDKPRGGMSEIIAAFIGAVVGALLACLFSLIQSSFEQWRVFQGKIYMVQFRLNQIDFSERVPIEKIQALHSASLEDVTAAVCGVKPYLFFAWQRDSLDAMLKKYHRAQREPEFTGIPTLPDHGPGWFGGPRESRDLLIRILDEMLRAWI